MWRPKESNLFSWIFSPVHRPSLPKHHLFVMTIDWSLFPHLHAGKGRSSNSFITPHPGPLHFGEGNAESKGVEPLYRINDNLGLANLYITPDSHRDQLSDTISGEKETRTLEALHPDCFQDSFLDQPDSLHCVSDNPDSYRENLFNPKALVLQTSPTPRRWRTHLRMKKDSNFQPSA